MKFTAHVEEYWNERDGVSKWYWYVRPYYTQDPDDYIDGSAFTLDEAKINIRKSAEKMKAQDKPTIVDWEFEL